MTSVEEKETALAVRPEPATTRLPAITPYLANPASYIDADRATKSAISTFPGRDLDDRVLGAAPRSNGVLGLVEAAEGPQTSSTGLRSRNDRGSRGGRIRERQAASLPWQPDVLEGKPRE